MTTHQVGARDLDPEYYLHPLLAILLRLKKKEDEQIPRFDISFTPYITIVPICYVVFIWMGLKQCCRHVKLDTGRGSAA